MSLIIFFGTALFVFIGGLIITSVTIYHWYKVRKDGTTPKENS